MFIINYSNIAFKICMNVEIFKTQRNFFIYSKKKKSWNKKILKAILETIQLLEQGLKK